MPSVTLLMTDTQGQPEVPFKLRFTCKHACSNTFIKLALGTGGTALTFRQTVAMLDDVKLPSEVKKRAVFF